MLVRNLDHLLQEMQPGIPHLKEQYQHNSDLVVDHETEDAYWDEDIQPDVPGLYGQCHYDEDLAAGNDMEINLVVEMMMVLIMRLLIWMRTVIVWN